MHSKIKLIITGIALLSFQFSKAQQVIQKPVANVWTADNGDGTFKNPLLWGDWADTDFILSCGHIFLR